MVSHIKQYAQKPWEPGRIRNRRLGSSHVPRMSETLKVDACMCQLSDRDFPAGMLYPQRLDDQQQGTTL